MTTRLFSELGISPEVLKAIDKLGFEKASPIQAEAIPVILKGKDVVGQSMTGSGKTAAFAIPAVECVDTNKKAVQVLILCPTRELAVQVAEEVHKLSLFKRGIHALPIYGGQSYERQFYGLKQGAHIVIGTPGRVMDHMRRGTLKLDTVKMVILDEADEMLDMGFREDIETVLKGVPAQRQIVFFSATMPRPIQELIQTYAKDPQTVRIQQTAVTVPTVEQIYFETQRGTKMEVLTRLIDLHDTKLAIIFCNTKRMVDDLTDFLNTQGYSADKLHGDMSQVQRDRVMGKFRKSGIEFLVATDVAARGIDVDDIQVVFNYDLPYDPEDYVHRIGRTGRAGRSGRAISFVAGREMFQIQQIERYTKMKIHRERIPSAVQVDEKRTADFLSKLRGILQGGEYKKYDHVVETLLEEGFASTDISSVLIGQFLAGEEKPAPPTTGEYSRPDDRQGSNQPRREQYRDRSAPDQHSDTRAPRRNQYEERPPQERADKPWLKENRGKPRASSIPHGMKRVFINVGSNMNVTTRDVVGAILGETQIPSECIGDIDIREKHLVVDIREEHAQLVIDKMMKRRIKGLKLNVKLDEWS
jgi:ATP-dependent RNA helicase DeaD